METPMPVLREGRMDWGYGWTARVAAKLKQILADVTQIDKSFSTEFAATVNP